MISFMSARQLPAKHFPCQAYKQWNSQRHITDAVIQCIITNVANKYRV